MHTSLTVSTCVTIREGCPIAYHLGGDDQAEFSFGGLRDGFEFVFDAEALHQLVKLGTEALRKLDARHAKGDAEEQDGVASRSDLVTTRR